jgi:class 3 adenylate cyclase
VAVHDAPLTEYAAVGDTEVAYQVFGDGSVDVLYFYGLGSHVDLQWDLPSYRLVTAFVPFSRVIQFDRRGTGASGGSREKPPLWEEWIDDVRAVLTAAKSERVTIVAEADAGPIAMLFAAAHPEQVSALVLANTSPRYLVDDDYPIGMAPETLDVFVDMISNLWGTEELARVAVPAIADDAAYVAAFARLLRGAATPRTAAAQYRYILESLDVRSALPLIQAPTLVLHNDRNPVVPVEHGRYLAQRIERSKFVVLSSEGVNLDGDLNKTVAELTEFLTGDRPQVQIDRVFTTILFTDIVGSTERVVAIGDQRWRSLLNAHDRAVRHELRRFRGREIGTRGDGFVASFDGPARAIRCAVAICEAMRPLGLLVRVGLHCGECEVRGTELDGLSVHIAARVSALASPEEILVTSSVKDMVVGSGIEFDDRGLHSLKGLPNPWQLLAVTSA